MYVYAIETENGNFIVKYAKEVAYFSAAGEILRYTNLREWNWAAREWGRPILKRSDFIFPPVPSVMTSKAYKAKHRRPLLVEPDEEFRGGRGNRKGSSDYRFGEPGTLNYNSDYANPENGVMRTYVYDHQMNYLGCTYTVRWSKVAKPRREDIPFSGEVRNLYERQCHVEKIREARLLKEKGKEKTYNEYIRAKVREILLENEDGDWETWRAVNDPEARFYFARNNHCLAHGVYYSVPVYGIISDKYDYDEIVRFPVCGKKFTVGYNDEVFEWHKHIGTGQTFLVNFKKNTIQVMGKTEPESLFCFPIFRDGKLLTKEQIKNYFREDRFEFIEKEVPLPLPLGTSPKGRVGVFRDN